MRRPARGCRRHRTRPGPRVERAAKQAELDVAKQQGQVLSTEISDYSDKIAQLQGEVAILRNREAVVAEQLRETIARLNAEKQRLAELRDKLDRSLNILSQRLVDIYKSDQPDALTVILDSEGFDDLVNRYDYLTRIQDQDAAIVARVRYLRDESKATVERDPRSPRRRSRPRRPSSSARGCSSRRARPSSTPSATDKASALDQVEVHVERARGRHLRPERADPGPARRRRLRPPRPTRFPPARSRAARGGMIWPVNGPVVSPFGMRWGRLHAGIDIAVPAGTPIRAAKSGSIALIQSDAATGGYGNYTCIDHGGGLSTCYAHQSSFAITSGSVSQGDVIGYVGCTGHCFGDHLHFEVRVNGAPVDPMGYL